MRNKNALLLAAVSAFALMTATTTNAAYLCSWTDGVKTCGYELGYAPSAGGESNGRDQHSGDHDSGSAGASGGDSGSSGSSGASGASADGGSTADGGDGGTGGTGGTDGGKGKGNNGKGNGAGDGSPNGKDDSTG